MHALLLLIGALPAGSPYQFELLPHAVATGAVYTTLAILGLAVDSALEGGVTCKLADGETRCAASKLNALDRTVVGNDSQTWTLASDVGLGVITVGSLAGAAIDSWNSASSTPGGDFLTDAVVMLEAGAVAQTATVLLKYAVRRPRPTQYDEGRSVGTVQHQLSFPSGHTSSAAALATAYATTFGLRHPNSPWRFAVYGTSAALTLATGYGRIAGGWHFYTDVLAGLVIGGAAGFAVPYLHRRSDVTVSVNVDPQQTGALIGLGGSF